MESPEALADMEDRRYLYGSYATEGVGYLGIVSGLGLAFYGASTKDSTLIYIGIADFVAGVTDVALTRHTRFRQHHKQQLEELQEALEDIVPTARELADSTERGQRRLGTLLGGWNRPRQDN